VLMNSIRSHILLGLATALFILQGVHAAKISANETEPWLQEQTTIRSIIYLESEQFKAGSAVPLCSLEDKCAQSQQRLAFTARAEKSTWFGTAWQLSLDYHSKNGPASMKLLDRTRLLKKDHLYESVLSFDQNTGECSVLLVDLTGGEKIYQGFAFIPWEEDALCPKIGTVSSLPIEIRQWEVTEDYQRIGGPILLEDVRFRIHGSDPDFPRTYSTEQLYAQITRPSGMLPGRLRGVIVSPGPGEGEELFSHSAADAEFSTKLATSLTPGRYTVALQYCLPDYSQEVSRIIVDVVPPTIKAQIDVPSALGDSTEPTEGNVLITSDCDLEGMRVTLEGELAQGTLTLLDEKIMLSSARKLQLPFMFVPTFRRLQLSVWSELKQMEPLQITMDWPFLTPDLSEMPRVRLSSLGLDDLAPWQEVVAELFAPEFTVLFRNSNPSLRFRALDDLSYSVPTWVAPGKIPTDVAGFLPHEFESEQVDLSGLTMNLFHAAESSAKIVATGGEWNGKTFRLKFANNPGFAFSAELIPLDSPYELELVFKFTPNQTGWYSIGFTGAPPAQLSDVESLWQPLIWQELRFPQDAYLTTEFNCPIPTTLVSFKGSTIGVAADPREMPYRLPTATNSRFGVALRNQKGHVQSMLFAPVLGGPESQMFKGETYTFRLRLFAYPGDWLNTYEYLARNIFGFTDYRANANGSLNDTLENMVEYALDDHFSGWDAEYRGSSYKTDVPGSVKTGQAYCRIGHYMRGSSLATPDRDLLIFFDDNKQI
jgi:hypothetical protein